MQPVAILSEGYPKLTYSTHTHNISVQAHQPLQMIKALTATGRGKQKETPMATYKAVMRPALEYALPYGRLLHPRPALTNDKSSIMQHWELPQDAHKTQTSAWRNTLTSHTRAPTAPHVTIQTKTQHPYTNIQHNTPRLKNTIFNNGRYTPNIPTNPHTITTRDIKTNMRHIHTSIVSRHLATRGNNKIMRTHPPHTSSSEERLPHLTRHTLAQLRTNKSPFLKSYLHKVDAKTHPSPLCPLCNNHTYNTHHLFNCTHIRTTLSPLDLWTVPVGVTALLAREADHKREHRTHPTSKGHGSG